MKRRSEEFLEFIESKLMHKDYGFSVSHEIMYRLLFHIYSNDILYLAGFLLPGEMIKKSYEQDVSKVIEDALGPKFKVTSVLDTFYATKYHITILRLPTAGDVV